MDWIQTVKQDIARAAAKWDDVPHIAIDRFSSTIVASGGQRSPSFSKVSSKVYNCTLWTQHNSAEFVVAWGRYKSTKTTNFGKISNFEFTKLQTSTSLARRRHTLFEPILQCVPPDTHTATRLVVCVWPLSVSQKKMHLLHHCIAWHRNGWLDWNYTA